MKITAGSSFFNGLIVFLKIAVILIFVILGWQFIQNDNYTPYIPANTGTLGEFGISGIFRGAAIVFFAFLGFDAVSTAAQETKNPKRDALMTKFGVMTKGVYSFLLWTQLYNVWFAFFNLIPILGAGSVHFRLLHRLVFRGYERTHHGRNSGGER